MERRPSKKLKVVRDREPVCPRCGCEVIGTAGVKLIGPRYQASAELVQKYRCRQCGSIFNAGRTGMAYWQRYPTEVKEYARMRIRRGDTAIQAAAKVKKRFRLQMLSHNTIYLWTRDISIQLHIGRLEKHIARLQATLERERKKLEANPSISTGTTGELTEV